MTLLTKGEEGQTLKITIWELPGACDDFNDLVFLIYCQEHRSSFYMEFIRTMTNRFPHIPDFAWISHALPLKVMSLDVTFGVSNMKRAMGLLHRHNYSILMLPDRHPGR